MSETRRRWEALRIKHRALFQQIRREISGFWAEVAELGQCHLRETTTTTGATVREFPQTRDASTQTENEEGNGGKVKKPGRDKGNQTPRLNLTMAALEAAADRDWEGYYAKTTREGRQREASRSRTSHGTRESPRVRQEPSRDDGCWNCGKTDHRYTACPGQRNRDFCYRCGEKNVTVRDCRRCQTAWRDEGPYIPGKSVPRDHLRRGE